MTVFARFAYCDLKNMPTNLDHSPSVLVERQHNESTRPKQRRRQKFSMASVSFLDRECMFDGPTLIDEGNGD